MKKDVKIGEMELETGEFWKECKVSLLTVKKRREIVQVVLSLS